MKYGKYYEAREIIEKFLEDDLFGPVKVDEIIEEEPLKYYTVGMLYPQETVVDQEETLKDELEDIQEAYDGSIALSNSYNPSSMAITTTVRADVEAIKIIVTTAQYDPIEQNNPINNGEEIVDGQGNSFKKKKEILWYRKPLKYEPIVDIPDKRGSTTFLLKDGLELQLYVQKIFKDGSKMITVALINKNKHNNSNIINNQNSFFQCNIELSGIEKHDPVFIEKKMQIEINEDPELLNLNMLYSHVKNYALGHGCSVDWEESIIGAWKISSRFIPHYDLKQMRPAVKVGKNILRMHFLANAPRDEVGSALEEIVTSYEGWISNQTDMIKELPDKYKSSADENMRNCRETKDRISECIKVLKENDDAFRAFQLANRAMLEQRVQFLNREGKTVNYDEITWYPFQLAFVLQEIPSIVYPKNKYRNLVDLLWFPTGGGKTEAYLGLSAFTIFFRRLTKSENSAGVTIIMRYTLRLLTIQQFERASALICACESIRRAENLGGEEISIGLWVGGGLTPNFLKEAEENIKKLRSGETVSEGNPCQILLCPWCGEEITPNDYEIKDGKMNLKCPSENCEFHGGLPVYLVDEDIYNNKPTLIVSTVDKFARMTWEPKVGEIFGLRTKYDPPELIIQDELHLISGPLGTITGLYEIAVSKFCEKNNIKAKIIASTATIRNAKSQILSLYGKDFRQFPPQGINIRDSYFAEESNINEKPSRKYLGILPSGKSATTTLVRVYACLLFASRYLKDLGFSDEIIDSYWTMTGYFNSLRELGGAVVQVLDDVQDRYEFLYATKFKDLNPKFTSKWRQDWYTELTSRKPNSEIAEIIQKKLKEKYPSKEAYHFVLASNMLSVGVDVGRLGIMSVTGQPKTNAEYIQASSRVGRENPGLVAVMYNPSHSRDRSHYEQFVYYHSAIYKFVEATSITPFSDRARERALHAVYISLCRQLVDQLRNNNDAKNFDITLNQVKEIEKYIKDYVYKVDKEEYDDTMEDLIEVRETWSNMTADNLVYQKFKNKEGLPLLKNEADELGEYATLNSMRNVDVQSSLYLEEE